MIPAKSLWAQQAQISGVITDATGSVISKASVEVIDLATGTKRQTGTNGEGRYYVGAVPPGDYRISVRASGFDEAMTDTIRVEVGAKLVVDFPLKVGSAAQAVTVSASAAQVNTTDAAISAVVDQGFVRKLPLNGRSFQSLLTLMPGVVSVPSSGSSGQISVNGMRAEQNYFQVDGVSANTGVNTSSPGRGAGYSGSVPNGTALGTTQSLVSIEALQEFRGTTSTYSAEYGRLPGGQFSFTTRSGSNEFHGSLFEYFRNDAMDANSFFNNRAGLPKAMMRQNNFGGALGGPVSIPGLYDGKQRTFFFYSAEALRLRAPQQATISSVPTLELRNNLAPPELRRILQSFPLPTPGYAEEAGHTAPFVASYSQPSSIDAHGLRLDHNFTDAFRVFGRIALVPSSTASRSASNLAQVTDSEVNNKSLTVGTTSILSANSTNDARLNVTWTDQLTRVGIDDFGGATPLRISDLDGLSETDWALFSYRVNTFPGFWLNPMNNRQRQFNLVDTFALVAGRHTWKVGVDYRQTRTDSSLPRFYQTPFYYSQQQLLSNTPQLYSAYRSNGDMAPIYKNLSLFVQDEWAVTSRLRLSLGLRWEVSPAPRDASGNQPFTVDQLTDLATTRIAPKGSELWKTTYNNFGPRIGVAYQLRPNGDFQTAIRAGAGLFHDTSSVQGSEGYWYGLGITGSVNLNNKPFPLTADQLQGIPMPATELAPNGYSNVFGFDPNLKLPYVLQWNSTVEQQLGSAQVLSVSYVGSAGKRMLIARQFYPERLNNPNFPTGSAYLYATMNGASSNYHALQAQLRRHYARGLQVLTSYTWSHAIDDASSNFTLNTQQRASANFDIRHNLQTAVSWDLPGQYENSRIARALFRGWGLDSRISLRSAMPVDITASNQITAAGVQYAPHPNLVTGQPLYVRVENAPGQRVINAAAFSLPPAGVEGNAGRNIARGFASYQTDLSLRREFAITERIRTTFRAEAFNLFNQANFGAISSNIQTATAARPFGWATGTQAAQLGGLNALYQVGGPRSMQLALRLQF
jgi:outer membrane receptor protein involved in Fe transport